MGEIVVIVEGETEQAFVQRQLAAHLGTLAIAVWPVLPGKNRKHGGVKKWEVARQDIVRTLKERRYCTTMFDYYALPQDWPGRVAANQLPAAERASYVEQKLKNDVESAMGESFDLRFFIPYIQLHEFEALAFSDSEKLSSLIASLNNKEQALVKMQVDRVLAEAGDPEAINDGYETCPSRRIGRIAPAYRKPVHGPIVTDRIGIPAIMERCKHFAWWIRQLEAVSPILAGDS